MHRFYRRFSHLSLPQKLLLGFGGIAAYLALSSTRASAATSPATGGAGGGAGGGGTGPGASPTGGANVTTPNAGDRLLVVTLQTGAAGQLNVRSAPGTSAGIVGSAAHGSTLTATGQVQAAPDGSVWWGVRTSGGVSGWSESNYLQDLGP